MWFFFLITLGIAAIAAIITIIICIVIPLLILIFSLFAGAAIGQKTDTPFVGVFVGGLLGLLILGVVFVMIMETQGHKPHWYADIKESLQKNTPRMEENLKRDLPYEPKNVYNPTRNDPSWDRPPPRWSYRIEDNGGTNPQIILTGTDINGGTNAICKLANRQGYDYESERKGYDGTPLVFNVADFISDPAMNRVAVPPGSFSASCNIFEGQMNVVQSLNVGMVAYKTGKAATSVATPPIATVNEEKQDDTGTFFPVQLKRIGHVAELPNTLYLKPLDFGWWWGDAPDDGVITLEPEDDMRNEIGGFISVLVHRGYLLKRKGGKRTASGEFRRRYHVVGTLDSCESGNHGNLDCIIQAMEAP